MATSDEGSQESKVEAKPEAETWRPGEAILLPQDPQADTRKASATDWFKSLFGVFGRGAPA